MKKFFTLLFTLLFLYVPMFSYEWGGLITESFKSNVELPFTFDKVNSTQSNSVSLWMNVPFNNSGDWYLAAQGSYKYNYNFSGFNKNGSFSNFLDLDLFKINGSINTQKVTVDFSLGRFFLVDNTSKIFAQNCDGLSIKFLSSAYVFGLYAGYTGLLNGNNIATLKKDCSVEHNTGEFYSLTHPYIPVSASLVFPSLFLNQSLSLQVNGFFDLGQDKDNRLFGTISVKGPIIGRFYYNFNTSFGLEDYSSLTNLSTLSVMAFFDFVTFKVNCEYASGNHLIFKRFRGFNSSLAYNASWNPEYSGVLLPGLDLLLSNKDICVELSEKLVMSCPEKNLSLKGLNSNLKILLNIFSDLSFNFGIAYYCDFTKTSLSNCSGSLGLSLSF